MVGVVGTAAGVNNWPAAESPDHAIDGFGQKYLNFGETDTGFLITPNFGSSVGTIVNSIKLWTANDAEPRDPASFTIRGTNSPVTGGGPFALSNFTVIANAVPLALPSTRNAGGVTTPLDDINSQTVNFANSAGFKSYLVTFPTVKDSASANSMQIAEVQLNGVLVPEPGVLGLVALTSLGVMAFRRRRA